MANVFLGFVVCSENCFSCAIIRGWDWFGVVPVHNNKHAKKIANNAKATRVIQKEKSV